MLSAIDFIETTLNDPETGRPFVLNRAERRFLARAFELTPGGRLKHPELVYSCPKKSGKTALAAMMLLYVVRVLGGRFAEGICVANDYEQAAGRVFLAAVRIVEASPLLNGDAKITAEKIEFASTGATIIAIGSDYASAAGSNASIVVFDELWGYTRESAVRLWDEMIPPPTRKIACRLTVTYAGFEGESTLLEGLYARGLKGERVEPDLYEQPGMLMFWSNTFTAPWQTDQWAAEMRESLRPNAYLRLIENRWVTSESSFIDMEWWDTCVDPDAAPLFRNPRLPVWLGVDASISRDQTAIVVVGYDHDLQKVRLVWHRVFQPSAANPLDFEAAIEQTVLDLTRRFNVREVRFDPFQMVAVSQRLLAKHVPMEKFDQTQSNLTQASSNLYELVKGRSLVLYPDADMRLAAQRAVAKETPRGWRIAKEKTSHKIDVIVALAQAALACVEATAKPEAPKVSDEMVERARAMRITRGSDGKTTIAVPRRRRPAASASGEPLLMSEIIALAQEDSVANAGIIRAALQQLDGGGPASQWRGLSWDLIAGATPEALGRLRSAWTRPPTVSFMGSLSDRHAPNTESGRDATGFASGSISASDTRGRK